jgi:hypothetical protein
MDSPNMKKNILLYLCLAFSCTGFSQSTFYDLNTIQKIEVFFSNANWDSQLDTAKAGLGDYIIADSVKINGIIYLNAGVKYKGASTYDPARVKNPIHISLDQIDASANHEGYSEIKLGNCYTDASMLREILAYNILANYMHCSKANFAQVYINNNYIGLYNNAEHVGNKFIKEHFYTEDNTIVKANPADVNAAKPDLTYQGADSADYYDRYELKSPKAWRHLINLCDTLNNNFGAIEKVLDIDRALWMLAFNNATVNLDSYTGSFKQNYYLARDNNLRLNPIIWDLNMCFGGFALTGTAPSLNLNQKQTLSPILHKNDAAWPLIQKALNNATFYNQYIAHLRTINNEQFLSGNYLILANQMKSIIDTAAINDVNKFYTNAEFNNSIIGSSSTLPISNGIQEIMSSRATYLNGTAELSAVAPVINMPTLSPIIPIFNSPLNISISISNASYAYLGYRFAKDKKFLKIALSDDGLHNDGNANDGIYGAQITPLGIAMQYYIYAENSNAGIFYPERAEHEFLETPINQPAVAVNAIKLNECMANNTNNATDLHGEKEDWIELYNTTNQSIALGNSYISDKNGNPTKWRFPADAIIEGNGFYTVWADEDLLQQGVHANFKLNDTNNFIALSFNASSITDSISPLILLPNQAFGRVPNGVGMWHLVEPTFNASNKFPLSVASSFSKNEVYVYPNPTHQKIYIHCKDTLKNVEIRDVQGQLISLSKISSTTKEINLGNLLPGIYFLQFQSQEKLYNFTITKSH